MTEQQMLNFVYRERFDFFLRRAFAETNPGLKFYPGWHIEAIVHQLDRVKNGECRRLIINQPPRSLKSLTISVAYVAWLLGLDPTIKIVVVSYSQGLATEFHQQFRRLVESPFYRKLFPATRWEKLTESDAVTTKGGGRFATSIDGQLTGRGGDLIIIDDPIKAGESDQEVARQKVIDFYSLTLVSRLNDKRRQAIILVMQRLHEDDLSGHLLAAGGWEHLNLPAIATEDADIPLSGGRVYRRRAGEVLQPEREDLATLERTRAEIGSMVFSAQYQQVPVPEGGNMVQSVWLQVYDSLPQKSGVWRFVQSWDVASSIGPRRDYSVCTTWLVTKDAVYLIDVWRGQLEYPELRKKAIALAVLHKPVTNLIEEAGGGLQLRQDLCRNTPNNMTPPIGYKPVQGKHERMSTQASRIEAKLMHIPRDAPWLASYVAELTGFPNVKHDDQVDSTSQLLEWWWQWRARQMPLAAPIILSKPRDDHYGNGWTPW